MKKFFLICFSCLLLSVKADEFYEIEDTVGDQVFTINSVRFTAQTICPDMQLFDKVSFIEGNAQGSCFTAKILNNRTQQVCEAWCNY